MVYCPGYQQSLQRKSVQCNRGAGLCEGGGVWVVAGVVQSAQTNDEKSVIHLESPIPISNALLVVKLLFVLLMSICCGALFSLLVALILARELDLTHRLMSGTLATLVLMVCLWSIHKFLKTVREALSVESEDAKPDLLEV